MSGQPYILFLNRLWRSPKERQRFEQECGVEPLVIDNTGGTTLRKRRPSKENEYRVKFLAWAKQHPDYREG